MFRSNGGGARESEERVFSSTEASRIAQVTLRQLQWWDERDAISPHHEKKRRVYRVQEVLEIMTVAALRRKGLSLQKSRRVLRVLRRELGERSSWIGNSKLWLLTDGKSACVEDHPSRILGRIADAHQPMYLICLSDQMKHIASTKRPRSSRKQLQLL